jgi:hypothetical protein
VYISFLSGINKILHFPFSILHWNIYLCAPKSSSLEISALSGEIEEFGRWSSRRDETSLEPINQKKNGKRNHWLCKASVQGWPG